MQQDPRTRNTYFHGDDIFRYLTEYTGALAGALTKVGKENLDAAKDLLLLTLPRGGRIFVGGNGGSAAIADHLCCDFVKGTYSKNKANLVAHSLTAHTALLTAVANDFGYEHTLSFQLTAAQLSAKDVVILISSSGNSPNIIEAAKIAKERKASIIGMTGFTGGLLKEMADVKLHIDVNNYGVVEDCHQALMHILAQFHFVSVNQ